MTVRNRDTPGTDERSLLLRHRRGDAEAFRGLVALYRRPVYSYLIRCGVSETDRDDLFQDVFIKIHTAAATYEADRPLHPWLFTIVANTVRNYHRRNKVREMVLVEAADREPLSAVADGERRAIARQVTGWLEHEIAKLPLAQREVLILSCVESLPHKTVADVLGLPINTVKTHLRRARRALVERLARRGAKTPGEVTS